jgi:glyoxylase-like metal-dependent hydrolase (beta-lactamase superfamily II)
MPIRLTEHLWYAQSEFFHTNSGVFLSEGEALLIDPCMRPEEIDTLAGWVRAQEARPRWLVLTHSHWDHVLGPERMPGVRTLAQAKYPAAVARDRAGIQAEVAQWEARLGRQRAEPFRVPLPDETFEDDHGLKLGGLELRLLHVPGHAPDQLAVYAPESGCLWASDILSDLEIPFVADDLGSYERTLARLEALRLRVLVPGHGHPAKDPAEIQTRFDEDRAYLAELRERVTRAVEQGLAVEETVALCADMPYRRPDENAQPHRLNVESAYLALGGKADARRVGWGQDWSLSAEAGKPNEESEGNP